MSRGPYPAPHHVHWSDLKWIKRSPAHYLEALKRSSEPKRTAASPLLFGSLTHHRTLIHQHVFALDEFAVWPRERRGNLWKSFLETQTAAGREVVTEVEDQRALRIAKSLLDDPKVAKYLVGETEKDRAWTRFDRLCAGRQDNVVTDGGRRVLVELKSTANASPDWFPKHARNMLYPEQLGWYADGLDALGDPVDAAVIVAVEVKPPFARKVYRLTPVCLARGRTRALDLLATLIECEKSGAWPAYGDQEEELDVDRWDSPDLIFGDEEDAA